VLFRSDHDELMTLVARRVSDRRAPFAIRNDPSGRRLRNAALRALAGTPCAGNPHARFERGACPFDVASQLQRLNGQALPRAAAPRQSITPAARWRRAAGRAAVERAYERPPQPLGRLGLARAHAEGGRRIVTAKNDRRFRREAASAGRFPWRCTGLGIVVPVGGAAGVAIGAGANGADDSIPGRLAIE
jgi:hypothetical protein